jgi:hypothetical protein
MVLPLTIIAERGLTCWSLFLILRIIHTATTTNPIKSIPPSTERTITNTLLDVFIENHTLIITALVFKFRKDIDTSLVPPELIDIEY